MRKIRNKSLYDISKELGTSRKNEGFNYQDDFFLLGKTMSPYMFRNDDLREFLEIVNEAMVLNIETIKNIRIHNNFTVDKNTKYIN
jgi:hypothetical protein